MNEVKCAVVESQALLKGVLVSLQLSGLYLKNLHYKHYWCCLFHQILWGSDSSDSVSIHPLTWILWNLTANLTFLVSWILCGCRFLHKILKSQINEVYLKEHYQVWESAQLKPGEHEREETKPAPRDCVTVRRVMMHAYYRFQHLP